MSNSLAKEPIVLQFEEQERKFSPKRRHKEEEEDVSDDELLLQQKNKVTRVAVEEGPGPLNTKVQGILPLKPTSYEIPCILGPASTSDTSSATRQTETQSGDRSSRNIAFLCARIAEELKKKGPQTRDELSSTTGFARQRICTVISVFKSIGLVNIKDSNTRRSEIEWNDQQARLLPNVGQFVSKILQLRGESKELKAREQELVRKIVEKRQISSSSNATTTMSSSILPSATIAPSPLLSLLSPQNTGTFGLEDEEKYGIQAKHMLGVDTSSNTLTMLSSGKAEGLHAPKLSLPPASSTTANPIVSHTNSFLPTLLNDQNSEYDRVLHWRPSNSTHLMLNSPSSIVLPALPVGGKWGSKGK